MSERAAPARLTWPETIRFFLHRLLTPFRCAVGRHEFASASLPREIGRHGHLRFARQCIHCPYREIGGGDAA